MTQEESEFAKYLTPPTIEEIEDILRGFAKQKERVNYPSSDKEVKASLLRFGGFSGKFTRVGKSGSVVIADGDVVVLIKLDVNSTPTIYDIPIQSFNDEFLYSDIENKKWATDDVIDDIHEVERMFK